MRSATWVGIVLAMCAAIACSDSTSPPVVTTRVYVLESVDGHLLPAVVDSSSFGVYTVYDGSLTLASNDSSVEALHSIDSSAQYGAYESSTDRSSQYRVAGDSIEVGFFGQCRDICASNRIGVYSDSVVTLRQMLNPLGPVYRYRHADSAPP